MIRKHLRLFVGMVGVVLLAGIAVAKTHKGEKQFKEGQAAELRQDWDRAVDLYQQALDESPGDAGYLIGVRRSRFQAAQKHVDKAQQLRSDGKLPEALGELQRAVLIDPASAI